MGVVEAYLSPTSLLPIYLTALVASTGRLLYRIYKAVGFFHENIKIFTNHNSLQKPAFTAISKRPKKIFHTFTVDRNIKQPNNTSMFRTTVTLDDKLEKKINIVAAARKPEKRPSPNTSEAIDVLIRLGYLFWAKLGDKVASELVRDADLGL